MNEYQVHVIVPTGTRSTCTSDMYIHKMKRKVNLERSTVCKSNMFVLLQGLAPTAPLILATLTSSTMTGNQFQSCIFRIRDICGMNNMDWTLSYTNPEQSTYRSSVTWKSKQFILQQYCHQQFKTLVNTRKLNKKTIFMDFTTTSIFIGNTTIWKWKIQMQLKCVYEI